MISALTGDGVDKLKVSPSYYSHYHDIQFIVSTSGSPPCLCEVSSNWLYSSTSIGTVTFQFQRCALSPDLLSVVTVTLRHCPLHNTNTGGHTHTVSHI